jgi:hypothetical protein
MIDLALAFAEAGFPILPIRREERRRTPMAKWDDATSDPKIVASWWRQWPDALPAIPLRKTNLCVVDADRHGEVDGVAALPTYPRCLGPHSRITTPSGGLHLVFAQPDPPITYFKWCEGVEILGTSSLLTCYDLEELKFPHVAPRAILPEVFWKPRDEAGIKRSPINNPRAVTRPDAVYVADVTAALREMDPCDWRGDYMRWFALMTACCFEGISERDFVDWSTSDPQYAADGNVIRKMWRKLNPQHGGALFAALAERGIKVGRDKGPVINGEPLRASREPTRNWLSRTNTIREKLRRTPTEGMLFSAACVFAEVMADCHKPTPKVAVDLLMGDAKDCGLTRLLGADGVRRTIANGLRHVEEKVLAATEEN